MAKLVDAADSKSIVLQRLIGSRKNAIRFKGIHKTLNSKHYIELNERSIRKYLPGLSRRTERIAEYYYSHSLSPANAGAQIN